MSSGTGRVQLRPMHENDVAGVVALQEVGAVRGLADVFPQDTHPFPAMEIAERWLEEVNEPGIACFIVVEDGVTVGFTATRGDELTHFGVAVERWGSGVAQQAHDATVELLAQAGLGAARLWVFDGNRRARRFYERLGWEASGVEKRSDFAPYPVLLEYRRDLAGSLKAAQRGQDVAR